MRRFGALSAPEQSAKYIVEREPTLIRGFELLATAHIGVAALRELISSLALQGRLVGQVSTDEPATSLIRRIATANGRGYPQFVDADLPTGWARVSFGDYANRLNTGPFGSLIGKGDYVSGGVPLVNPSHMRRGRIAAEVGVAVSPQKAIELAPYALATGDIVFARRGEVGRTALVTDNEDGWLCGTGSFFACFEREVDRAFVQLVFDSIGMRRYLAGAAVGVTMVNLNQRMLRNAVLDLPPLAEQHRIVARVEELMKLCDALEQSGRLADEQHERLVSALFDALAASESAHALAENWQRIAEHFDLLLDRPEAIDDFEQTILQLAVDGLLVLDDKGRGKLEETTLGTVVSFLNGYAFKSEWFRSDGVRLVRNVNIAHGKLTWANGARVDDSVALDLKRFALRADDLVISLDLGATAAELDGQ